MADATSRLRAAFTVPGWTRRSDVQRIELYTRGSLRVLLWFLLGTGLIAGLNGADSVLETVVTATLAIALGLASDRCLVAFMRIYPAPGPIPLRLLVAVVLLLVAGGIWVSVQFAGAGAFGASYLLTTAAAWALGGSRDRRLMWAPVPYGFVVMGLPFLNIGMALYGAAIGGFFVFTVQSSLWVLRIVHELDAARRTQADLAVAEERLRFSRDVHDVMGRHLSTIAVQAELAATLAERGDERAADRARDVRASAHAALREARSLARGYRPLDLAQEVEGAVSLLASAGIASTADLDGLEPRWAEPVARVVRESVTNVLRHSQATHVEIVHRDGFVEVRNDGLPRPFVPGHDGSGLEALGADLAEHDATLTHGVEDGEFVVRVRLDAASRSEETP